jgi:sulfur-oxidizing protein SoxZ
MSSLAAPRIRIPRSVRAGEVFEVRTLIEHPMETGLRQDGSRAPPRDLLERLQVQVNGAPALDVSLRNGTAANPFHVFFLRLARTSEISFTWTDGQGRQARASHRVSVG